MNKDRKETTHKKEGSIANDVKIEMVDERFVPLIYFPSIH